ncbi:hypothetical protein GLYMA_05G216950v4 [Glycine max]|nr:hypothetical protein GLYMA_05G216950v4 [Glycine max]KAH1135657.1 hypothetical protein GYH30_013409 [Glycine max]
MQLTLLSCHVLYNLGLVCIKSLQSTICMFGPRPTINNFYFIMYNYK